MMIILFSYAAGQGPSKHTVESANSLWSRASPLIRLQAVLPGS